MRVWVVVTRQIVAYFVGDRSTESAQALRERMPPEYRCRATRSDFWLAYEEVFPSARTGSAAKPKAKPTTPNASSAPCDSFSVAS